MRPSIDLIPNNSCEFEKASMVEIVGDPELMTVTREVVPFVNVHTVPFVRYDLTQKNNVHKIVLQSLYIVSSILNSVYARGD